MDLLVLIAPISTKHNVYLPPTECKLLKDWYLGQDLFTDVA